VRSICTSSTGAPFTSMKAHAGVGTVRFDDHVVTFERRAQIFDLERNVNQGLAADPVAGCAISSVRPLPACTTELRSVWLPSERRAESMRE
jgi:hypothetical protein